MMNEPRATSMSAAEEAALLSEIGSIMETGEEPEIDSDLGADVGADVEAAPADDGGESAETDDAETDDAETDDADDDDGEVAEDGDDEKKTAQDPEIDAKALDKIQRRKKRLEEENLRERAAIQEEREALVKEREALSEFRQLQDRAKIDPIGALRALGYPEGDLEYLARQSYELYKAAEGDPKYRDRALAAQRQREQSGTVQGLQARIDQLEQANQQNLISSQLRELVDGVVSLATNETPLAKRFLEEKPAKAKQAMRQIIVAAVRETGEVPDDEDIFQALEAQRREAFEELGISPEVVLAVKPKPDPTEAGKKKSAKTLTANLGTKTTMPRNGKTSTYEEEMDQLRADLRAGRIEE